MCLNILKVRKVLVCIIYTFTAIGSGLTTPTMRFAAKSLVLLAKIKEKERMSDTQGDFLLLFSSYQRYFPGEYFNFE